MTQNLIYALIQVVHNENAAAIVALGVFGTWQASRRPAPRLALTLALLWALQGATGALFGLVTYTFDRHLPDIHGIAIQALLLKMLCVLLGFVLALWARRLAQQALSGPRPLPGHALGTASALGAASTPVGRGRWLWSVSSLLGIIALGAAAFLRWFS